MKIILIVFSIFMIFSGCTEQDLATQKRECKKEGKKFKTIKVFNFIDGKYEIKGECK
ncbi:MAG: hypothetical protein ACNI3C_07970 [Candidatus Marinarcus sp.]|uniref:hypothetical protein n=1 Tax=Candidatus Marinarcus sp. TaxID=3100987 RepID=UPI003AFF827E